MAIPAQTLTVELTESESQLFFDLAEIEHPGSTGAEKKAWAETVAKQGVRLKLADIQAQQIRQAENANRQQEKQEFEAAFPPVPEWAPEPEEPQQP